MGKIILRFTSLVFAYPTLDANRAIPYSKAFSLQEVSSQQNSSSFSARQAGEVQGTGLELDVTSLA